MRFLLLAAVLIPLLAACKPQQSEPTDKIPAKEPKVTAEPVDESSDSMAQLKANLAANLPGIPIDQINATPVEGIYEIRSGLTFGYVSADGRYLFAGDLSDLKTGDSVTEERRRGLRHDLLANVPEDQSILYAPEGKAKHTVTVFTDIDCGYCRKMHQHIAEYNKDGIAVRYLFFPRSGPDTESFAKAEQVWCAKDRNAALTQAKLGGGYKGEQSCANPVLDHLQLGSELGVRGTPAIFLPDGELVPGYRTPEQLLSDLSAMPGADAG